MNDAQTDKRTRKGGGRAYHSRLEPHVEFIREQRRHRKTWKEIAELLSIDKACSISFQGVHQFYRRHLRLSARPHWEREATAVPPTALSIEPSRRSILAATPPIRSFKLPNPERINLNDPSKV